MANRRRRSPAKKFKLKNIKPNQVLDAGIKTGSFILGYLAGKKVMVLIDKQINKSGTEGIINGVVEGVFGFDGKKHIPAAAVTAVGLTASQFLRDEKFKFVSYGAAGAGGLELIKNFTGKDLISGMGSTPIGASYARLPELEAAAAMLPDLPSDEPVYDEEVTGFEGGDDYVDLQ